MALSDVTVADLRGFLRLPEDSEDDSIMEGFLETARVLVATRTGVAADDLNSVSSRHAVLVAAARCYQERDFPSERNFKAVDRHLDILLAPDTSVPDTLILGGDS